MTSFIAYFERCCTRIARWNCNVCKFVPAPNSPRVQLDTTILSALKWSFAFHYLWKGVHEDIAEGRPIGEVEYQNTRNKHSNIPKIILKLVYNAKIKKSTVYFIPKVSRE